jgi:hypothetical protein
MITTKDILDLRAGVEDKLTLVQLFREPDSMSMAGWVIAARRRDCYNWCQDNLGKENELWYKDGLTIYSWRIIFTNKEDAVAFKLRFGL